MPLLNRAIPNQGRRRVHTTYRDERAVELYDQYAAATQAFP